MIPKVYRTLRSLFYRPNLLQVAALCWRKHKGEPQVLLIRSLDTNRWIIPKGWPMRGKTLAEAAAIEAWEEAGVKGDLSPKPIGSFHYLKERGTGVKQPCDARVFGLHVQTLAKEFPESHLRRPQWFTAREAANRVDEPELQALILSYLAKQA
jgi:8-oxo-dGTP pyrophosphatase MutT (NUDIX family)